MKKPQASTKFIQGDRVRAMLDDDTSEIGIIYEKADNSDYYFVKIKKEYHYIHSGYLTLIT